jgi:hypothetical protein
VNGYATDIVVLFSLQQHLTAAKQKSQMDKKNNNIKHTKKTRTIFEV